LQSELFRVISERDHYPLQLQEAKTFIETPDRSNAISDGMAQLQEGAPEAQAIV
jgi:hypothetical protein